MSFRTLRVRTLPRYPALIVGTDGIGATHANGTLTLALDFDTLTPIADLSDVALDETSAAIQLEDGSYRKVPLVQLVTLLGTSLQWSTDTDDSDPGAGYIKANNAVLTSATEIYVSKTDYAGNDISTFLATLDDSTSTLKGTLTITLQTGYSKLVTGVTGITDATGYVKIALSNPDGLAAIAADAVVGFQFLPSGDAGDVTGPVSSVDGNLPTFNGADGAAVQDSGLAPADLADIRGLVPSRDTDTDHDINFTAGVAVDGTGAVAMVLASEITKQGDATFAAGDDAGGMVSGESLPTSGTVHAWLIAKADGTVDVCFNNNATSGLSPTLPTGYIYKRRIGSLLTDGSANFVAFLADELAGGGLDITRRAALTSGAITTTGALFSAGCPSGVKFRAKFNGLGVYASATWGVLISDPAEGNPAVSLTAAFTFTALAAAQGGTEAAVRTNTSAQCYIRGTHTVTVNLATSGWIDDRR